MAAQAARVPRGWPPTVLHVPILPSSAHPWHWPVHAPSQQTPSTQKLLAHWLPAVQLAPLLSLDVHVPDAQRSPVMHSLSTTQAVLQAEAEAHASEFLQGSLFEAQACVLSQVWVVSVEPAHEAAPQEVPLAG